MKNENELPNTCPECKSDLRGPEIPEVWRHHYAGKTHYHRVVGIYDRGSDRTVAWRCPDCGHGWSRT